MTTLSALCAVLLSPFFLGGAGIVFFGRVIRTIPGLLFHSVSPNNRLVLSSISVSSFRAIAGALETKNFTTLTMKEAVPIGTGTIPADSRKQRVLLTFDDGCRSFFSHALPVLEALKFKATVFPVAGYIGRYSSWDVMPSFPHLTKPEIMEISALGHEIGSHGLTHADLTYLGPSDLKVELGDSKKILEDITGKKVTALSFPFGSWNTRVWELAQELGYCCGTIYRKHGHALPGLIPVHGVYGFDTPQTILDRIAPAYPCSLSMACARIMSHFAKGAPLWKFDTSYLLRPDTKRCGIKNPVRFL